MSGGDVADFGATSQIDTTVEPSVDLGEQVQDHVTNIVATFMASTG